MKVKTIFFNSNGTVMVFGEDGQQMSRLQGGFGKRLNPGAAFYAETEDLSDAEITAAVEQATEIEQLDWQTGHSRTVPAWEALTRLGVNKEARRY